MNERDAINRHLSFLKEKVFQIETKWPHYERLLNDLVELASRVRQSDTVVIMERAYIYAGHSLFAPLFPQGNVLVVDCRPESAEERFGYQESWMNHDGCIRRKAQFVGTGARTSLPDGSADVLVVPNLVHHERDQDGMFREFARLLKPTGTGYIFEALLRELHQMPDDYVRYTPSGFEQMFSKFGLRLTDWRPGGGPFEAIAYCWIQALQHLPIEERESKERWFFSEHFGELMDLDRRHQKNLVREHTSFPVGYSIFFGRKEGA